VTSATPLAATETITLKPSYNIPIVLIVAAIGLTIGVKWWVGLPIGVFGLFLLLQCVLLKLQFTATALDVYRGETLIRSFPYAEWTNWEIFWAPVPILFYFREVKSIHFLPIIFDPTMLRLCLEQRCPRIEPKA
jgi:Protein of unknown function (DUF3119)